MSALDDARANLDAACQTFNRCANSTTPPGMLQLAVNDHQGRGESLGGSQARNSEGIMTGTTFISATCWPYMAGGQAVVVLPDAEAVLRANGWVHRTDPLRDQLAHTPAHVIADLEET